MAVVAKRERLSRGRVGAWVLLLGLGQLADLITTQAAMARGAVEGNVVAAGILDTGGLALLWAVKALLVVAMAIAIWLVKRYWDGDHNHRGAVAATVVWRGLQVCVAVLALTAVHNLAVIGGVSG